MNAFPDVNTLPFANSYFNSRTDTCPAVFCITKRIQSLHVAVTTSPLRTVRIHKTRFNLRLADASFVQSGISLVVIEFGQIHKDGAGLVYS